METSWRSAVAGAQSLRSEADQRNVTRVSFLGWPQDSAASKPRSLSQADRSFQNCQRHISALLRRFRFVSEQPAQVDWRNLGLDWRRSPRRTRAGRALFANTLTGSACWWRAPRGRIASALLFGDFVHRGDRGLFSATVGRIFNGVCNSNVDSIRSVASVSQTEHRCGRSVARQLFHRLVFVPSLETRAGPRCDDLTKSCGRDTLTG